MTPEEEALLDRIENTLFDSKKVSNLTPVERLHNIVKAHNEFKIVGGDNITVAGSLRKGYAICSTCPEAAATGFPGIVPPPPPPPPPSGCGSSLIVTFSGMSLDCSCQADPYGGFYPEDEVTSGSLDHAYSVTMTGEGSVECEGTHTNCDGAEPDNDTVITEHVRFSADCSGLFATHSYHPKVTVFLWDSVWYVVVDNFDFLSRHRLLFLGSSAGTLPVTIGNTLLCGNFVYADRDTWYKCTHDTSIDNGDGLVFCDNGSCTIDLA